SQCSIEFLDQCPHSHVGLESAGQCSHDQRSGADRMLNRGMKSSRESLNSSWHPAYERAGGVQAEVVCGHAATRADNLNPCSLWLRNEGKHYFANCALGRNEQANFFDRGLSNSCEVECGNKRDSGMRQEVRDEIEWVGDEVFKDSPVVDIAPGRSRR